MILYDMISKVGIYYLFGFFFNFIFEDSVSQFFPIKSGLRLST